MKNIEYLKYGYNFQIKLIVALMLDRTFLEQIYDILDVKLIEAESLKWIFKKMKTYFEKYQKSITFDIFKIEMETDKVSDIIKSDIIDKLRDVHKNYNATDLDFIKDKSVEFFKNQNLKGAIVETASLMENTSQDYDKIRTIINNALNAGTERNIGHEYLTMITERYDEENRNTIPTPWSHFNEAMDGGLSAGELGVIVAPSGVGKSWILQAMAAHMIQEGKDVVYYTMELNEIYVGKRVDSILSGINYQELKYREDEIHPIVNKIPGKLTIKYFPTKYPTAHTLLAHTKKLRAMGIGCDAIIVDYADIIKDAQANTEMRHALGNIYEDLRGIAGELEVPMWTASQANKSALQDDIIEAERIAESYQKIMTADFVLSLSRHKEDKIANTGRFHVIKNRFGPDGMSYSAEIDTNKGYIRILKAYNEVKTLSPTETKAYHGKRHKEIFGKATRS
jgi:replicative DNA helicase